MMSTPVCRPAELGDLKQVVDVHIAAFPGFFLTSLGPMFLAVMYRAFLKSPGGLFLVADAGGVIQGFAVGVSTNMPKDRSLALKSLPGFLLAVMPAVMRNPVQVSRRLAAHLFSKRAQPDYPHGAAVLRSIGLRPDAKGSGVGSGLLAAFEQRARVNGASTIALTTDALENERAIGFYTKQGYSVREDFKQHGTRSMLLMTKKIAD